MPKVQHARDKQRAVTEIEQEIERLQTRLLVARREAQDAEADATRAIDASQDSAPSVLGEPHSSQKDGHCMSICLRWSSPLSGPD